MTAAPSTTLVAVTGVLALLAVLLPGVWRRARAVVTIAHEGAHGLVAALCGRRLAGIQLHSDTSGLAVSHGKARGPGMIATAAAGYLGPALLGLGASALLVRGYALGALWSAVVLLALLLLQIRNLYGLWLVLAGGVAVFAVSWWGSTDLQAGVAYAGTWFLLLAAPKPVLELARERRRGRARSSDADTLARLTHLPGIVWVGILLLGTVGCLAAGARWLVLAAA